MNLSDIFSIIKSALPYVEPGHTLVLSLIGMVLINLYLMHRSPTSRISFEDLFIDSKTGRMGGSEFRLNTAFLASTLALLYLTLKGLLTEWFFMAYLAAFVFDRINSRKKDLENDIKNAKNASQPTQPTDDGRV